jgi:hypothetical protein
LASRLSNLNGELFLNGVSELSMEAIPHLSKLDGSLALDGWNSLADGSLRLLFANKDWLSLNCLVRLAAGAVGGSRGMC